MGPYLYRLHSTHAFPLDPLIIAIDGPAGSGKSTTARGVAERLGFLYLDTGAMYRAVALGLQRREVPLEEPHADLAMHDLEIDVQYVEGAMRVLADGRDLTDALRTEDAAAGASRVAQWPSVRRKMVDAQRRIARRQTDEGGGVVLDGRDIGTVVFPDADLKIFLVADDEVRARRRFEEQQARGNNEVTFEAVLDELRRRDKQDTERTHAPLRQADDAIALDTTALSIEEQIDFVVHKAEERRNGSSV